MGRVIMKKVRLTEAEAAELSMLSRETNRSESEILRTAIPREGRLHARRKHAPAMAAMAEIGADTEYRWEAKH
jgi:hypothetical protein